MPSSDDPRSGDNPSTPSSLNLITRPLYSAGLILADSDLTAAVDYTRDLSRLLFRTLFGSGVLAGFHVDIRSDPRLIIIVAPGVALNGYGDPLQLLTETTIELDGGDEGANRTTPPAKSEFWVIARGNEHSFLPKSLISDDSSAEDAKPTRSQTLVEISVTYDDPGPVSHEGIMQNGFNPSNVAGSSCWTDGGVLLAKAVWYADKGWTMTQEGVRRFVRPALV